MTAPGWLDEVPLDPGPPHVRLGTRRVAAQEWLVVDDARPIELALKATLLDDRRNEVVAVARGHRSSRAQAATLALVEDWLTTSCPGADGPAPRSAPSPDSAEDPPAHHAPDLERAARLVQEDLCLMTVGDGPPVLVAAVVCFPSHWRLADKIGRPMAAIHDPVPDYADTLGTRPDRIMEALDGDRIVARRNWSVHDGAELFAPTRPAVVTLAAGDVPDRLWLRSERQTLRRLTDGDHILFTIRVQQVPVGALVDRPDVAARLATAVRAEAPDRLDRIAGGQVEPLVTWLDRIAP